MTTVIKILVLAVTTVLTSAYAQDFQGVATYKTQRKIDVKMDSTQMNSEMQTKMMEMMKKQFPNLRLFTKRRNVWTNHRLAVDFRCN